MTETFIIGVSIIAIVAITLIAFVSIVASVMYFTEKDIRTKLFIKNKNENAVSVEMEGKKEAKKEVSESRHSLTNKSHL